MEEKEILIQIFQDAKVRRASLLAEYVCSIDRYLTITEEELNGIRWVDKKGNLEPMIAPEEAEKVIINRETYLDGIEGIETKKNKIREIAIHLLHIPVIKRFLGYFTTSRPAIKSALVIKEVKNFNAITEPNCDYLSELGLTERPIVHRFISNKNNWELSYLEHILDTIDTIIETLFLLFRINGINVTTQECKLLKTDFLTQWFVISGSPNRLVDLAEHQLVQVRNDTGRELIRKLSEIFRLELESFRIALLFMKEILKMEQDIPKMARDAITTGNPFLFRSLFLKFDDAKEFAVGGKLNSSLETKYGNLFEKLMSAFGTCRSVYNGGIDVAVGEESFDIKSGPNVMNKSQVDAFSAKQALIEDIKLLPGLNKYEVALGYGLPEQLNSFMATIDSEILTGREAWIKITGKQHSPEIVFAIAGLVARLFGKDSIVSSMLGQGNSYQDSKNDHINFKGFFDSVFSPVTFTPQERAEIEFIDSILRP